MKAAVVQPQISQFTRVCGYDRAGLGWSDPSPHPRTSKVFAQELDTLPQKAEVRGPYALAGYSLGVYNVRMYASLYPADVVGMVLVDSAHPNYNMFTRLWPEGARVFRKLPADVQDQS